MFMIYRLAADNREFTFEVSEPMCIGDILEVLRQIVPQVDGPGKV